MAELIDVNVDKNSYEFVCEQCFYTNNEKFEKVNYLLTLSEFFS